MVINSIEGQAMLVITLGTEVQSYLFYTRTVDDWHRANKDKYAKQGKPVPPSVTWRWRKVGRTTGVIFPYWFPLVLFGLATVAPWINYLKWQFSVRTLLTVTTVLALILGLIILSTR
jgi:hypothetical protein